MLVSTGHDERHLAEEFRHWFADRRPGIARVREFQPGEDQFGALVEQIAGAKAALVLGGVEDTARAVEQLRTQSSGTTVYAGPAAAKSSFIRLAGKAADGVRCPLLARPGLREWVGLDYGALVSYDATQMVVSSIREGGLNRFRICRALAKMTPWQGAAGEIRWSALNRNSRSAGVAMIQSGRLEAFGSAVAGQSGT